MTGDEIVSLYKREFLGINKECDKKFSFTNDTFETYNDNIVKNRTLLIVEGIFFMFLMVCTFLFIRFPGCGRTGQFEEKYIISLIYLFLFFYSLMLFPCFISQLVFFLRIKKNNLVGYDCSDTITK